MPCARGFHIMKLRLLSIYYIKQEILMAADCINHTGCTQNTGYGQVRRAGKLWLAHRWAAHIAHGPCPSGLVVRHTCDNRLCINPDHLIYGTQGDNLNDRKERHIYRKLDRADAEAIKLRLKSEVMRTIAEDYGVSIAMIHHIKTGKQWA